MKIQHHIKSALALIAFAAASQASAGQITLNATGIPATTLNNNSYTGLFDGSALLPASFTVNSLGFSFLFADNTEILQLTPGKVETTYSKPVVVDLTGTADRKSTITITNTNTTPDVLIGKPESASVSFGGLVVGSGATSFVKSDTPASTKVGTETFLNYTYMKGNKSCTEAEYNENNNSCKRTANYTITNTVTTTHTEDYTGNITLSGSLMTYSSLLADLIANKQLGFGINVTGDLNFISAKLDIDYTPVAAPVRNDVPEPGSLALFGIAMLGVASARRARRA